MQDLKDHYYSSVPNTSHNKIDAMMSTTTADINKIHIQNNEHYPVNDNSTNDHPPTNTFQIQNNNHNPDTSLQLQSIYKDTSLRFSDGRIRNGSRENRTRSGSSENTQEMTKVRFFLVDATKFHICNIEKRYTHFSWLLSFCEDYKIKMS